MLLAEAPSMVITPDNFDPPLKRIEAHVPGYWTVEELAEELELSLRTVQYLIKGGYPKKSDSLVSAPSYHLKTIRIGTALLVSDTEALKFLWERRESKMNLNNS